MDLGQVILAPSEHIPYLLDKHRGDFFKEIPILQLLVVDMPGLKKNLWAHTKEVCSKVPAERVLRWAALFHDVGKPIVYNTDVGSIFTGHDLASAAVWSEECYKLDIKQEEKRTVERLIRMHMRIASFKRDWSDAAIKRLVKDYGGDIELGIELALADGVSPTLTTHLRGRLECLIQRGQICSICSKTHLGKRVLL